MLVKKTIDLIAERRRLGLCPICKEEIAETDKGLTKRVRHSKVGLIHVCRHHYIAIPKEALC